MLPSIHMKTRSTRNIILMYVASVSLNTLRPRQDGRYFPDDIFKSIFLNENVWISIQISLKFVPRCPIHYIPALVQIMAWRRPGDKPLSEPNMVSLLTHICVTRPQWVKTPRQGHHIPACDTWIWTSNAQKFFGSTTINTSIFNQIHWWNFDHFYLLYWVTPMVHSHQN